MKWNGMKHKRWKLTGRTFGQFSYILERSSGRDKVICSYQPVGALWQFKKDIRQGNYAFNHFKASYGPANGLYGVIKNDGEGMKEN